MIDVRKVRTCNHRPGESASLDMTQQNGYYSFLQSFPSKHERSIFIHEVYYSAARVFSCRVSLLPEE